MPAVASHQPPPRAKRQTPRRLVGVSVAVAVMVVLLAEVAVRIAQPALATPSAWPTPELENKYDQMSARAASHQTTDAVLVGDSMMDAGGDPDGLAAARGDSRIYNASVAGETLPTIVQWTTRVVVPRLHPRVVVIGLSSNELNPASLAPSSGIAAYQHSRAARAAEGLGDPVDRADAFLRRWSMLYRYRNELRSPMHQRPSPEAAQFDPKLSSNGQDLAFSGSRYLEPGGVKHARLVDAGVTAALKGFTVSNRNVAVLTKMITTLRAHAIEVVLIAMPVTADLVSFHPAGAADYQWAMSSFMSIAASSDAVFAEPGVWPTSEFADPVHLNGSGTARFSAYLAPLLRRVVDTHSRAGK